MSIKNQNIYNLFSATSAKAISAIGVISLQFIIARTSDVNTVGQFSSILSILFLIGIVSRWGGAELIFKDTRVIESTKGINYRNSFILSIMTHCFFRGLVITSLIALINTYILPLAGLNKLIPHEYYFFWFIAPLFSLSLLNANFFYFLNRNFIAGISEPGGIAFITFLIATIFFLTGAFDSNVSLSLYIYAAIIIPVTSIPAIYLIYSSRHQKRIQVNEPLKESNLFQSSLLIYFSQWGVIAMLATVESSDIVGIFAVCLQLSVILNFAMRVAGSLYSHKAKLSYKDEPIRDFAAKYQTICRVIASFSVVIFVIIVVSAQQIYEIFKFTDERFFFIFFTLITARFINNLFGTTDMFLSMTYFQKEYKWILILSSSLTLIGVFIGIMVKVELAAIAIAFSILFRNLLSSYIIYKRSGIIMLPFYVTYSKK
jgi:hypothetical protein